MRPGFLLELLLESVNFYIQLIYMWGSNEHV